MLMLSIKHLFIPTSSRRHKTTIAWKSCPRHRTPSQPLHFPRYYKNKKNNKQKIINKK